MHAFEDTHTAIDFDYWLSLAKANPEQFEIERNQVIDAAIRQAPKTHQHRLRCLQWRLDQERSQARHPMAACVAISRQMWSSLYVLSDALHGNQREKAPVLEFRPLTPA